MGTHLLVHTRVRVSGIYLGVELLGVGAHSTRRHSPCLRVCQLGLRNGTPRTGSFHGPRSLLTTWGRESAVEVTADSLLHVVHTAAFSLCPHTAERAASPSLLVTVQIQPWGLCPHDLVAVGQGSNVRMWGHTR